MKTISVHKMKEMEATVIVSWSYPPPYDFYNQSKTEESKQELLNANYYSVYSHEELIGFFCLGESARVPVSRNVYNDEYIDIGIGMKPSLTGKGFGHEFFSNILTEIGKKVPNQALRLTVAAFNQRAISLYEKFDFMFQQSFQRKDTTFYVMIRKNKGFTVESSNI